MAGPRVEVLTTGFELCEAPRVDDAGAVWFTDVLGGGVRRWSPDGTIELVVPKRRGVGGLALHRDGGVVVSGRDVTHVGPDGTNRLVFAPPDGVTGFNDICALPDGSVVAGALRFRPFGGEQPVPGEFWHVERGGERVLVDDIDWANGCGAIDDRVYVCDYARGIVHVCDSTGCRVFARTPAGEADGLAVDGEGGVWVAQPRAGSIVRFDPAGTVTRTVELPGQQPASLAFGGDGAPMYVTTIATDGTPAALLRVDAGVSGPRHHLATL